MGRGARTFSDRANISRALASALMMSTTTIIACGVITDRDAYAQNAAQASFNVPAGPLNRALTAFGRQAGLQVTYLTSIGTGKTSPGISGLATREQAIARILQGTGLSYSFTNATTVAISQQAASGGEALPAGAIPLDTIDVQGANPNSTMTLMPEYAGGQVATGGQIGLLGNRGVMDTPFNQTSFTQKTIQNQQARSVADVMLNDPSVTPTTGRDTGVQIMMIRGFVFDDGAMSFNGLPGLASGGFVDSVERVEVLKGPSALLNGMPPSGGAIGGSVNIVPKRASDEPLTQLTTSYISRLQLGAHVDIGRRFGENKEFGVRFNGRYQNGDGAYDPNRVEQGLASLGLDYRGQRVRISVDLGYQNYDVDGVTRLVSINDGIPVPPPPDARRNLAPNWAYEHDKALLGTVQGEVDLSDNVTAYAAIGTLDYNRNYQLINPLVMNTLGDWIGTPFRVRSSDKTISGSAGVRASIDTGPVHHALSLNVSQTQQESHYGEIDGSDVASNLYNPVFIPDQGLLAGDLPKVSDAKRSSVGIADTLSIFDKRVQCTVGVRRQQVKATNFEGTTSAPIDGYDASAWSPAYALVIKPWENVSLYANYIEGLEQGVTVGPEYANAGTVFPPYQSKQYETGIKVDWGRLTTTVSAFQIARTRQS